jgi:hypothetical protein
MAKATLAPDVIHLVEPNFSTHVGQMIARCGALVPYRDEGRRLAEKLDVTCPGCLAGQADDEATTAALSEKRFIPFDPDRDRKDDDIDDVDRSDGDEAEAFAEDVGENGDVEDFEDPDYPDGSDRQSER